MVVAAKRGKGRKRFRWMSVQLRLNVLGGLYQVRLPDEDDEPQWEEQWVSTKVTDDVKELTQNLETLATDTVDAALQGRPAWLLGFRVVLFRNK